MKKRRALRKVSGAACLAASLIVTQPSEAVEDGFSEYFFGLSLPMIGYVPPPGLYFRDTFLLYHGRTQKLDANLVFNIAQAGYFFNTDLFGATLGFVATIPFIGDRNSISASFTDPSGTRWKYRLHDDIASIADTDYSAVLGWHAGDHNWCVVLTAFTPTGNYKPGRFVQTGLNRPGLDIKGAYTFLSLQTGMEVSGALGILVNALNNQTDYQSGAELHFEWALNQHFPFGLAVGVGGYLYQQVTDDYSLKGPISPNRARAGAVGPLLSYTIKAGAQEVILTAKWFHDFAVQNRPRADAVFASLNFRL